MTTAVGRKTKNEVALNAFFSIAEKWKLEKNEQMALLGIDNDSTYYKWMKEPAKTNLGKDTFERISYILGIFKDLQILFSDGTSANTWIKKPNSAPLFGGKTALDLMIQGKVADLYRVRNYLAQVRGV